MTARMRPWQNPPGVLPSPDALTRARESLPPSLPEQGIGDEETESHILNDIVPGFNHSSDNANYYGFVTGGVNPAALSAEKIVAEHDQNVQVHLPNHSVATDVEHKALGLLAELLDLDTSVWHNGTFTTGATASNVLGLACGREFALRAAAARKGAQIDSVGEFGLFQMMMAACLSGIQVLTTMPHSSLVKAAGILGIGRSNVKDVGSDDNPLRFDMKRLETELARTDTASIVAVSCGEVNTGQFATNSSDMLALRRLCDQYGSWLHVDGAFGIFSRILDSEPDWDQVKTGGAGVEMADSITGDGHKLLNVPYDCGFFLSRHLDEASKVFRNANAAYLSAGDGAGPSIPSPLNIGIENSRRFRALPVYASLLSLGKSGYREMLESQIRLARKIAGWLFDHPKYITLPQSNDRDELLLNTYMVVLFAAQDDEVNQEFAARINDTRKMFVSGTTWQGRPACRIAIANYLADEGDFNFVAETLESVV